MLAVFGVCGRPAILSIRLGTVSFNSVTLSLTWHVLRQHESCPFFVSTILAQRFSCVVVWKRLHANMCLHTSASACSDSCISPGTDFRPGVWGREVVEHLFLHRVQRSRAPVAARRRLRGGGGGLKWSVAKLRSKAGRMRKPGRKSTRSQPSGGPSVKSPREESEPVWAGSNEFVGLRAITQHRPSK